MKIAITETRGIPSHYGGFEQFAEYISVGLVEKGHGIKIYSENHVFHDTSMYIKYQGEERQEVIIGEDCWIGAKVKIFDGIQKGDGSVIAAGSVVKKLFPPNSVIAGVPVKLIKTRV